MYVGRESVAHCVFEYAYRGEVELAGQGEDGSARGCLVNVVDVQAGSRIGHRTVIAHGSSVVRQVWPRPGWVERTRSRAPTQEGVA